MRHDAYRQAGLRDALAARRRGYRTAPQQRDGRPEVRLAQVYRAKDASGAKSAAAGGDAIDPASEEFGLINGQLQQILLGRPVQNQLASPGAPLPVRIAALFSVRTHAEAQTYFDVCYDFMLAARDYAISAESGRRHIVVGAEKITYAERRVGAEGSARRVKAFDTFGVGPYDGLRPDDIMRAMIYSRDDHAQICALRMLAESSGTSFLFLDRFAPYAERTILLRPGAYLLRALRDYAADCSGTSFLPI